MDIQYIFSEVLMTENKIKNIDELEAEQKYEVGDTVFTVKPVFKEEGKNTLATILLSLMQGEVETT